MMGKSLTDTEIKKLLKEAYKLELQQTFEEEFRKWNRLEAERLGWKRDRANRVKWIDVQKLKVRLWWMDHTL